MEKQLSSTDGTFFAEKVRTCNCRGLENLANLVSILVSPRSPCLVVSGDIAVWSRILTAKAVHTQRRNAQVLCMQHTLEKLLE